MKLISFFKNDHFLVAVVALAIILFTSSCEKFLDEKPDQKLSAPATIEEAQALLDDYAGMNTQAPNVVALSDDDFFYLESYYNAMDVNSQLIYKWEKDVYPDNGWKAMYKVVMNANLAIETIDNVGRTAYNASSYDNVYGSSLMYRSFAFLQLLQVYGAPYKQVEAGTAPGISLRLNSDISTPVNRNSIEECYSKIELDTKESLLFLPDRPVIASRPSKAAAYSLLSNMYLIQGKYSEAGKYADSALQIHSSLLNYNTLDTNAARPFTRFNTEVIFSYGMAGITTLSTTAQKLDTLLYDQYESTDLRRPLYFRRIANRQYGFKGSYQNSTSGILFNGYTVGEMFLIRAECAARNNDISSAISDINTLRMQRYRSGTYMPLTANSVTEAMDIVLKERRMELVGRGKRWIDLRRLNLEPAYAKVIRRMIAGNIVELAPGSKRYTFYLPQEVIQMNGIMQNER